MIYIGTPATSDAFWCSCCILYWGIDNSWIPQIRSRIKNCVLTKLPNEYQEKTMINNSNYFVTSHFYSSTYLLYSFRLFLFQSLSLILYFFSNDSTVFLFLSKSPKHLRKICPLWAMQCIRENLNKLPS